MIGDQIQSRKKFLHLDSELAVSKKLEGVILYIYYSVVIFEEQSQTLLLGNTNTSEDTYVFVLFPSMV